MSDVIAPVHHRGRPRVRALGHVALGLDVAARGRGVPRAIVAVQDRGEAPVVAPRPAARARRRRVAAVVRVRAVEGAVVVLRGHRVARHGQRRGGGRGREPWGLAHSVLVGEWPRGPLQRADLPLRRAEALPRLGRAAGGS